MMAYSPQQPSLPVHSSDLLHSSNSHTAFTNSSAFKPTDEPIYYYTIAKGDVENLSVSSLYDSRESSRLCAHCSYDDVRVDQCRHDGFLKRDISTPWMTSPLSRESDAFRPDSCVYQNCYCWCSISRSQNLTTTFQSQRNDVWQARKYYCEEEVVIVLRDEVERAGFSIGGIIPGNHGAAINSVLSGSPANKAGLQVGDCIVEVNGCSTEGKDYAYIVGLIHQCIKSRVIQLRLRRKHETSRKENSLNNPEITISDAFLVSSDKRQADEVTNILKRNHPGVRIHDMEMLVDGSPKSQANASVNARNDLTSDQIWDRISNESSDDNMITTCTENENESERLKNYENDLRRRRELNEHRTKEAALLRRSLRGSRKLLSLENQKSRKESSGYKNDALSNDNALETCYANSAYVAGDTFCDIIGMDETGPIPLEQVMISMNRVVEHLEKAEGREEESKLLRDFFTQKPVQEAIENNIVIHKAAEPKPTTSAGLLSITNDCNGSKTLPSTRIQGDLKIVKVNKCSNTYLGATIRNEGERVIVGRVVGGGMAEKSNLLREGDELIEANGNDLRGKNITEVCNILKSMSGELSLVIAPLDKSNDNSQTVSSTQVKHFRALFDYDPEDDIYVPCKELALKFQRGDILHVISMSDENWWQAYREGCEMNSSLAGLIPSMSFQRQVALYAREFERENQSENGKRKDFFGCTKRKNLIKGKWKKGEELKSMDELSDENDSEILIYEEVTLYLSKTGRKRPLVLCGPEGVGCLELRQRLAEFDKDKFASAIPHTTRPKKSGEIDGVHYHFVTKHSFQEDAKAGKFIEYGEFEKYLYGTSLASIQAVIDRAKICLLTLKAENLKALRRTIFMPFVVFIAPPSLQQLRRQKEILGQHGIKDEQLKLILSEGKTTEKHYGHLFDRIIVNVDLDRSLEELKEVIRKLETEPHWVPSFWPINTDSISSTKYDEKLIY